MKDLQAIIDKRAEEKLNKEIGEIHDFLCNKKYNFLRDLNVYLPKKNNPLEYEAVEVRWLFSQQNLHKVLFQLLLNSFKEKEAEAFVNEVAELKAKVADLNEEISFLQ